jgi:hypothetical protein
VIRIDHAKPAPNASVYVENGSSGANGSDTVATSVGTRLPAGLISILLILIGSGFQGEANGTIDAFLMAFLLLLVGGVSLSLVFPGGRHELRAYLMAYGVCVFVGGLAQCYSLATFGDPQSTIDAVYTFFPIISPEPPFTTMEDIPWDLTATALAILIWQRVYEMTWALGFTFGPYIGVMFNAFVMGLTGAITVRAARELFGNDAWRLRRVGTLFAVCGLFILFGSVLIRDCFTTFFNTLAFWGLFRWLCMPSRRNLLIAGVLTSIAVYAMTYLRERSVVVFGLIWLLGLTFWFFSKRLNVIRLGGATITIIAIYFVAGYLQRYVGFSLSLQSSNLEKYVETIADKSRDDSLGVDLILRQPLPIRLVAGTGMLMTQPIPLWVSFRSNTSDYHLIKGYHGVYQLFVLPLVFAGFVAVRRMFTQNTEGKVPLLFLIAYSVMNTLAVVATSMEQRHVAQFLPAMIVLAAVPDTRERTTRKEVQGIAICWFAFVCLLHLLWALATIGR